MLKISKMVLIVFAYIVIGYITVALFDIFVFDCKVHIDLLRKMIKIL